MIKATGLQYCMTFTNVMFFAFFKEETHIYEVQLQSCKTPSVQNSVCVCVCSIAVGVQASLSDASLFSS